MQMALLLRYQTFFLVAFHGVSCRWKRSGSNSFSVQQRLGSASVLWYLLHHRLQPASSLYFTSFVHQPMQPYSNSCMLHFSVFREFHLKWKKWKRFFYFFGTLILPWYHQTPPPFPLLHINRTGGHEWRECILIWEECRSPSTYSQTGLMNGIPHSTQIAFMMSHLKYQFPPISIPFKGDLYVWEFDHGSCRYRG